jgi:hypothetical protein
LASSSSSVCLPLGSSSAEGIFGGSVSKPSIFDRARCCFASKQPKSEPGREPITHQELMPRTAAQSWRICISPANLLECHYQRRGPDASLDDNAEVCEWMRVAGRELRLKGLILGCSPALASGGFATGEKERTQRTSRDSSPRRTLPRKKPKCKSPSVSPQQRSKALLKFEEQLQAARSAR